jgi:hypothetical protein
VVIQAHVGDDYATEWGWDRWYFYDGYYVPRVQIDGLIVMIGSDEATYETMEAAMLDRLVVPTDVTAELYGEEVSGQTYCISAVLNLEEDAEPRTVRVHLADMLFNYPENVDGRYNNGVMQGVDLGEFDLAPGQTALISHEFTFTDLSWERPEDIRIALIVQEPLAAGPAEVHQSEMMTWPFPKLYLCPADLDGDENVGTADLLALLAAWGNTGGPEDINGDGIVNTADLLELLAAWGPCPVDAPGACCLWDETCVDATWYDCMVMGHSEWFEGEECADFQCPDLPTGACCIGTECIATNTEYECMVADGIWYEGEDCATYVCELIYCEAEGGCDEYIANITCGDIDNSTECDHYGDYTAFSTDLVIGIGHPFTLTIGNPYSGDQGGLWVDWNQDGDFEDANEEITTVWVGYGPYSTLITPPADAVLGPTRLRARLTWNEPPTACGTHTYGEVEDYTVNVLPPPGR